MSNFMAIGLKVRQKGELSIYIQKLGYLQSWVVVQQQ